MPEEIKKRYVVRFKRKDIRPNKRDDKIVILKNAVNMNLRRITRKDERVLAVHEVGENSSRLAEDPEKIVDINEFSIPLVTVSLSPDQAEALKEDENVQWVYEDKPADIRLFEQSEILPFAPAADAVRREYLTENIKRMKAPEAWAYKTGYGVRVCVMDSGIDKTHPDLAPNFQGGAAFISGDSSPPGTRNDWKDGGFHGTGCAGIVGAVRGNNQGVVGMAPDCFLYDARVFGINGGRSISNAELTAAFVWCGNNQMDVVSMSFGADYGVKNSNTGSWPQFMHDQQAAIRTATGIGTIFVGASGNDGDRGNRNNRMADQTYPGAYNFVACTGAIEDHQIADFSNTGNAIHFVAPGTNNQGSPNESTGPYGLTTYAGGFGNTVYKNAYGWFNGTSMATPHVAGVMALGQSAYKPESCVVAYNGLGTKYVRTQVIARAVAFTADGLGTPPMNSSNLQTGYGLPNAEHVVRILLNINDEGNQVGNWPAEAG